MTKQTIKEVIIINTVGDLCDSKIEAIINMMESGKQVEIQIPKALHDSNEGFNFKSKLIGYAHECTITVLEDGDSQSEQPATGENPEADNTKEESFMNKAKDQFNKATDKVKGFDYKKVASPVWNFIKKAAGKAWNFTKKHGLKAAAGLGAVTLAGTFTHGTFAAIAVGMGLYAGAVFAIEYIKSRKEKAQSNKTELVLNALGQAAMYTSVAPFVSIGLCFVLTMFANAAIYGLIGHLYMTYFIVA